MKIQVNAGEFEVSEPIEERVVEEVSSALKHFTEHITRVEVHLRDLNGPGKSGIDKRCTIEARLAGHDPLAIHEDSDQMYQAIRLAAKKLERAVRNKLERHRERLSTD